MCECTNARGPGLPAMVCSFCGRWISVGGLGLKPFKLEVTATEGEYEERFMHGKGKWWMKCMGGEMWRECHWCWKRKESYIGVVRFHHLVFLRCHDCYQEAAILDNAEFQLKQFRADVRGDPMTDSDLEFEGWF